jgi:phytanoyl-CoA hydroxylase
MAMTTEWAQALADSAFPHIDATTQECITDEQAQFFRDNGLLVIRNFLQGDELRALQEQTGVLIHLAEEGLQVPEFAHPDFFYQPHQLTGERTPFRVEYILDKTDAGKTLMGHPFLLKSVEKLQGRNFVPTWDSMVFKRNGLGAAIPWHRDAGTDQTEEANYPIFNVDFYLDAADLSNCLWGILGSNKWPPAEAKAKITELNQGGAFGTDASCVPILMNPGDVIFHNILALHGSPAAQTHLRRVLYYEFRPAEIEISIGPHVPEYIPLKQKLLLRCLKHRAESPFGQGEVPFVYNPDARFAAPVLAENEELPTYRYAHGAYWRG